MRLRSVPRRTSDGELLQNCPSTSVITLFGIPFDSAAARFTHHRSARSAHRGQQREGPGRASKSLSVECSGVALGRIFIQNIEEKFPSSQKYAKPPASSSAATRGTFVEPPPTSAYRAVHSS